MVKLITSLIGLGVATVVTVGVLALVQYALTETPQYIVSGKAMTESIDAAMNQFIAENEISSDVTMLIYVMLGINSRP